jgi:hypothetical protein
MTDEDLIREQLRTVPYPLLASELARRNAARRKPDQLGGRPAKLRPCKNGCGAFLGAREMRRHKCQDRI